MYRRSIYYLTVLILILCSITAATGQNNQTTPGKTLKIISVPSGSLKPTDIGSPEIAGTFNATKAGVDITAGGADIWGVKDEFTFACREQNGDFDFIARIESLTAANLYTKAGIMAREELTAGSRHVFFQVFPDNRARNKNNGGYEFQHRSVKDGEMKAIYPANSQGTPEFPVSYPNTWIRLQRIKNDFIGFYSSDGISWKEYTKFTFELPSKLFLGLAVTSHNTKSAATAVFRNIEELKH